MGNSCCRRRFRTSSRTSLRRGDLQRIAGTHSETNFGRNAGGGVKIGLAGRFDCGWTIGCSYWEAVR
jgi:hypothetical protein